MHSMVFPRKEKEPFHSDLRAAPWLPLWGSWRRVAADNASLTDCVCRYTNGLTRFVTAFNIQRWERRWGCIGAAGCPRWQFGFERPAGCQALDVPTRTHDMKIRPMIADIGRIHCFIEPCVTSVVLFTSSLPVQGRSGSGTVLCRCRPFGAAPHGCRTR